MAHDLDITKNVASFASARLDAWHGLGQVLPSAMTAEEALAEAHLADWFTRKEPLIVKTDSGVEVPVTGKYGVVRNNPIEPGQIDYLGVVGGRYQVVQNEDHVEFLNNLVDESGAHFETAGAIEGGRKVFVSMKLPGSMKVGGKGGDEIERYITAINSHDGSCPFMVLTTATRVVCANTLRMALGNADNIYRVRHTSRAMSRIQEARDALELSFDWFDALSEEANRLVQTAMTEAEFMAIMDRTFGIDPDDKDAKRNDRRDAELEQLWSEAGTQKSIRDTAWAGLMAGTEWFEHFSPVQGDARSETRAIRTVFDGGRAEKLTRSFTTFVAEQAKPVAVKKTRTRRAATATAS